WSSHPYRDLGGTEWIHIDNKNFSHSGTHSLRINSQNGADAGWRTNVKVKPNTDYRLAGFIRTKAVRGATGALLNVHGSGPAKTLALQKNNDWTEVEVYFNSGNQTTVTINCLFGGWGTSQGIAWYDDISLREISLQAALTETAKLDGDAKRGHKIFNEHPIASCIRCHQVDGQGGFVGPYLDGIGKRKQADYIRESIIDPQAKIAEGFVAEVSPMPPFGVLLKPQEIEDIMAYLLTLKKDPDPSKIRRPETISFE
ncbi:c-type cytochrome, partial [Verrucomicrobia bacterium]|nr:c-type cytochrome [Verrucomicrobiota bacterium]